MKSSSDLSDFRRSLEKEIVARTRALLRSEEVAARSASDPGNDVESLVRIRCPKCGFTFWTTPNGQKLLGEKLLGFSCPNCKDPLWFKQEHD